MHRAWILALTLLTVPLIGCIGADDDPEQHDTESLQRAEVTESTGGIQGTVTDAAIEAIDDATVTLTGTGDSVQSAGDGSFAFSELTPDTYTLTFEADGYLGSEREIDVYAGEISFVDMILTEEPDLTPYVQQYDYTGFMECSWGIGGGVFIISWNMCSQAGEAANTQTTFTHEVQPDPWQIVTEVDWDPNTPLSDRFWMNVETTGFNSAWHVAFADAQETPPIVYNTDREQIATVVGNFSAICEGEMDPRATSNHVTNPEAYCGHNIIEDGASLDINVLVQTAEGATVQPDDELFPVGAGLGIQQEFTVMQTIFYHGPACEDYSLLHGNECEQAVQPPEDDPYDDIDT